MTALVEAPSVEAPPVAVPAPRTAPAGTTGAGVGGRRADGVYGLLRLAGTDVALPLEVLREVVHCPDRLAPLPSGAPGLLGAMNLRGTVLPVLDLRCVLDPAAAAHSADALRERVVVVVASGEQVLGLLADEVKGVTRMPGDRLLPVTAHGTGLLFSHTFQHPDDGTVTSVLDVPTVLRDTGVPTIADTTRQGPTGGSGDTARRQLTVVRCGQHLLAVDVAHVHTTLPPPTVAPSVLDSALCRGVTDYAEHEVPVVDPLVLFGLGELRDDEVTAGLVLDLGHGYVVLALTALLDLVAVPEGEILPLPVLAAAPGSRRLITAVLQLADTGACLVVDGTALAGTPELASLAAMNTALETHRRDGAAVRKAGDGAATAGGPYLTYSAGADLTTPLDQVLEILPFPTEITGTAAGGDVLGVVVHRASVVPVIGLAALLGRSGTGPGPSSCVLLVDSGEGAVAFAVDRLRGIEPLTWSDADQTTQPAEGGRLLQSARLVQVGTDARLLPEIDLRALAGELRETAVALDGR